MHSKTVLLASSLVVLVGLAPERAEARPARRGSSALAPRSTAFAAPQAPEPPAPPAALLEGAPDEPEAAEILDTDEADSASDLEVPEGDAAALAVGEDEARAFRAAGSQMAVAQAEAARRSAEDARTQAEREKERVERKKERDEEQKERVDQRRAAEEDAYERGTQALDDGRWDQAIRIFDDLVRAKSRKADAALYWKAYAQNKRGQRTEAIAAIAELQKSYPDSRWAGEAKALESELRRASGQAPAPESEGDDEMRLLALNGLMHSDSERAVPMLEKILEGSASPKVKDRALFVLCQSGSPRAREVAAAFAKGQANPALQMKAIKYLGLFGGKESRQTLSEIYAASTDVDVKRAVLRSFMLAGEKDRVLAAAKGESSPELRREAIRQLGLMGAQAEVWELYRAESSPEVKKNIIEALFLGGAADRMVELSRSEKDPSLRRAAIQKLGLMGGKQTGDALVALYAADKDPGVRQEVLQAFFLQGNAKALIEVARKETDPALRKRAVEKLSLIGSKESTDFLLEILNK